MKNHLDRTYPILLDIQDQIALRPSKEYVFLYDDGHAFRAFIVDGVKIGEKMVTAWVMDSFTKVMKDMVTIPEDTPWRLLHTSNLEFVPGREMEEIDLMNMRAKRDSQRRAMKEESDDAKLNEAVKHEYELGYNPKVYA